MICFGRTKASIGTCRKETSIKEALHVQIGLREGTAY